MNTLVKIEKEEDILHDQGAVSNGFSMAHLLGNIEIIAKLLGESSIENKMAFEKSVEQNILLKLFGNIEKNFHNDGEINILKRNGSDKFEGSRAKGELIRELGEDCCLGLDKLFRENDFIVFSKHAEKDEQLVFEEIPQAQYAKKNTVT
ncbi:hypothetical protein DM860_002226 [Cuscuta australis]|uniref:Uncharacterized protein n=1 Tax=Cuscuta australis TaxID=267555 RepID=A0A328DW40_9ASTE|nr:hypothetical protein DM860_002226 [Cuscuta australis]